MLQLGSKSGQKWKQVYFYQAALLCDACGDDQSIEVAHLNEEDRPQRIYRAEQESDSVEHCDRGVDCIDYLEIDGTRIGAFLNCPLTTDGVTWLIDTITTPFPSPFQAALHEFWAEQYDCYLWPFNWASVA